METEREVLRNILGKFADCRYALYMQINKEVLQFCVTITNKGEAQPIKRCRREIFSDPPAPKCKMLQEVLQWTG